MGIFNKNNNGVNAGAQPTQRAVLEARYRNSRLNLLLVVIFTTINMAFLFLDATSYFLFSAAVPYFLTYFGLYFGGKFPAETYADVVPEGYEFVGYGNGVVIALTVIAALIVVAYLLCWIFSKKNRVGWIIAALVMFSLDTIVMFVLSGFSIENLLDILFHIWVLIDLILGISAYFKLKKLPVEEIPVAEDGVVSEVVTDEVSDVQSETQADDTSAVAEIAENTEEVPADVSDDANFI